MKIVQPAVPYLELKQLVSSMESRMRCPHGRRFWVIIICGAIRVALIETEGNRKHFPVLDELYNGDELKPDARERLLSMLDDTEWTM